MNSKRLQSLIALSLVGALSIYGCGDSDGDGNGNGNGNGGSDVGTTTDLGTTNPNPDVGPGTDTGNGGTDVGPGVDAPSGMDVTDMGTTDTGSNPQDVGPQDVGPGMDADAGVRADMGSPAPSASEGGSCAPGGMCPSGLDCLSLSPMGTPAAEQLTVCLRQCMADTDCTGSLLTPPANTCWNGVCVQRAAAEGEQARLFRPTSNDQLSGCGTGLLGITLEDGVFSCIRTCQSMTDCSTPGIGVCSRNTGAFTSTVAVPGICLRGNGYVGAPCRNDDISRGCTLDWSANGLTVCRDYFGQFSDPNDGICSALCGDVDGNAMTPPEACVVPPNRPGSPAPSCLTEINGTPLFTGANGMGIVGLGTCDDNCTAFPNNCTATPTGCYTFGPEDMPLLTRCYDVLSPTLPLWPPSATTPPTAAQNCAGRENRCPDDAYCFITDTDPMTGLPTRGGCIFGCDSQASGTTPSGCEGKSVGGATNLTCASLTGTSRAGFCR